MNSLVALSSSKRPANAAPNRSPFRNTRLPPGVIKQDGTLTYKVADYKVNSEVFDNNGQIYTMQGVPYAIWMTGVVELWKRYIYGTGVVVGVIDNGVDANHPSLKLTADGRPKILREFNMANNPNPARDHGTLVAALIAGFDMEGYKGCAPNAQIFSYVVTGADGTASDAVMANAVNQAVTNGCHIINISMGSDGGMSSSLKNAIDNAFNSGVIIICSSGNSSANTINYPAYYEKCVSVSGVEYNNSTASVTVSGFASTNNSVDYTAVATNVLVCTPGGGYGVASGTSFSAPIISGITALLREEYLVKTNKGLSKRVPVHVQRMWLNSNSLDIAALGEDDQTGSGIVSFFDKCSGQKINPIKANGQ